AAGAGFVAVAGRAQEPVEPPDETYSDFEVDDPVRHELDTIADLLIDGKAREAHDKAAALLKVEGLSEEDEARARKLLEKANAKLSRSAVPPSIEIRRTKEPAS